MTSRQYADAERAKLALQLEELVIASKGRWKGYK